MRYTYSRWDGAQGLTLDADALLEALSDELIADGDVENALQRITRFGLEGGAGMLPGAEQLIQRLREERQAQLRRYDLDSALGDIKERVQDIVATERRGLEQRAAEGVAAPDLQAMLDTFIERKRAHLDQLASEPGAAVSELAEYEFLDDQARDKFRALEEMLERHVLERHVHTWEQSLRDMPDSASEVRSMLHDLNAMLQRSIAGDEPDFARFKAQHGRHFPGADSLDDLLEQLQDQSSMAEALMASMSPDMRRPLEDMLRAALEDHALREELALLAEAMDALGRPRTRGPAYPFSGEETITLNEAMRLMRRMQDLDALEAELQRGFESGDLGCLDAAEVRRLLGARESQAVVGLQQLAGALEAAGYATKADGSLELTARGMRRIGQKALRDIFHDLQPEALGNHQDGGQGTGGEALESSRAYQFGDPFLLDLHGTLMNAVERSRPGAPLTLAVEDFEVFHTEQLSQAATVMMLDMSRSMPLRGCFAAAKKVTLALNTLIRLQFPRDQLYVVGFSDYARRLRPETLHRVAWGDYVYGTNMQHGLMVARRLLGRHKSGSRQIILITDGEPTAHFEGGKVHFAYPPTFRTFQETLREVKRCTQEGIVINTFMLERSHYLTDFVKQMTRINHGRAFFATPERLGDYILVDYVRTRTRIGSS